MANKKQREEPRSNMQHVHNTRQFISALANRDPLKRIEAAEAIGQLKIREGIRSLARILRGDPNELVRAYAASTLGVLGKHDSLLLNAMRKEHSELVLVHLHAALVRGGQDQFLLPLCQFILHPRYHVRCTAAHLLAEVSPRAHAYLVRLWLKTALQYERTIAVRSSIKGSLQELSSRFRN